MLNKPAQYRSECALEFLLLLASGLLGGGKIWFCLYVFAAKATVAAAGIPQISSGRPARANMRRPSPRRPKVGLWAPYSAQLFNNLQEDQLLHLDFSRAYI